MAKHLADIFGTEKDRVNCPFYYKIGACRHGERCSRQHNKPQISQSILLRKLYSNPYPGIEGVTTNPQVQEDFDDFYEDIFDELSKFGRIDEMTVCDNVCEHLQGNVYVKFYEEDDAEKAIQGLTGRFYAGKPILPEFSPVTDFREASCRQQSMGGCDRGGQCNFIHVKPPSVELELQLFGRKKSRHRRYDDDDDDRRRGGRDHRGRSRSRSRSSSRDRRHHRNHRDHRRSRSRERDRDDQRGDRDRDRHRDRDHRDDRGKDRRDYHSREDDRDYRREPRGDEREREGRRDDHHYIDDRDRDRERERDGDGDRGRSASTSGTN